MSQSDRHARWYAKPRNKAKVAARAKHYFQENKDQLLEKQRAYRRENRELINARQRQFRRDKAARLGISVAMLSASRKQKANSGGRKLVKFCSICGERFSCLSHRGGIQKIFCAAECAKEAKRQNVRPNSRQKCKKYYLLNREKISERRKKWRAENSDHYRLQYRRYQFYGSLNPTGEQQWLKRNQAMLRNLRRALRSSNPLEALQSLSKALVPGISSLP